ncbi:MAG: hypothetical protein LBE98_04065, partial [Puniceicoccales bacterium]|nr:hypothetical protein [Puniceicoccales bacterium]
MGDPDPSLVQGETVASESPLAPSQAGSIGEHGIAVQRGPESNPQPQLNTHQWTLKEKFGLPERACASFNTNREEMGTFFTDLEQGKFDPGS